MPITRILIGLAGAAFFSGMFMIVIRQEIVKRYGKHTYDVDLGRGSKMEHYVLDERARQRVRRLTWITFLLLGAVIFLCMWSTCLTPEEFRKFFPGL